MPNLLNDLEAKDWLKFTKTWFIHNPPPRKLDEKLHPAKYPEDMIEEFILFFTKQNQTVLDPFLGTGSTLIAAHRTQRNGLGIELLKKYADIALKRIRDEESQQTLIPTQQTTKQTILLGNSLEIDKIWQKNHLPPVDFVITSPPYGPMLSKKGLAQKKRAAAGFDLKYSQEKEDIGNIKSYSKFILSLVNIFIKIKKILKKDRYLTIIIQNYVSGNAYRPLAWDFAKKMSQHFTLKGERLWLQNNKTLYPYGYRYSFVPNVHHHYCLIFKNDKI